MRQERTHRTRHPRAGSSARSLAQGLGWFSIGLGIIELLAGRRLAGALGMEEHSGIVRAYGVREVVTGLGLLAAKDPTPWIWARVGGDAVDLASLSAGFRDDNPERERVGLALGAVAGVAALDIYCAQALHRDHTPRRPTHDYSDRSGFPRPPEAMRGAARASGSAPSMSWGSQEGRQSGAGGTASGNRGFGVRVTLHEDAGAPPRMQPLVVVARSERDAELVAAKAAGGDAETEILRELDEDEVRSYGLDLTQHGQAKARPALDF